MTSTLSLQEVLLMEEITSFKADLSDDTAVQMSQATFTWESEEEEIIGRF